MKRSVDQPTCARRTRAQTLVASATSSPDQELTPAGTFRLSLLAGAAAGFTADAILFPLDTLKTRLQVAAPVGGRSVGALFTGVYAGFGPAVVASAPAAAAFFGVYDTMKRYITDSVRRVDEQRRDGVDRAERYAPLIHVAAAAIGDVAGATVRVPFEVVKQRLQSGVHSSAMGAVKSIIAKEGVTGFFAGYGSLILRELPFGALQFPAYEYLKKVAARRRGRTLETWETSVCGSLAGGFAAGLTTPIDVIKTRLMTQNAANPKYHGVFHGMKTIAAEEGAGALISGISPRVMWMAIGGAIFFGAYEASKKAFFPFVAERDATRRSRYGKA